MCMCGVFWQGPLYATERTLIVVVDGGSSQLGIPPISDTKIANSSCLPTFSFGHFLHLCPEILLSVCRNISCCWILFHAGNGAIFSAASADPMDVGQTVLLHFLKGKRASCQHWTSKRGTEWERWLSAVIRRKCQNDPPPPLVGLRRHREKGLLGIRENRRFPAHFDRFIPFLYVFFPHPAQRGSLFGTRIREEEVLGCTFLARGEEGGALPA